MFPNVLPPITAFAGGGKTNATKLAEDCTVIGTCATAGDSVMAPIAATPGVMFRVINNGVAATQVYGIGTDTIGKNSAGTGYSQAAFSTVDYMCNTAGNWVPYNIFTDNLAATTDPTVTNDNTQGYGPGSEWFNTSNNRAWTCLSAATGAANWFFSGAVVGSAEPAGIVTQFGSGTALMGEEGNINRQISAAGVQPGATGADNVIAVYSLPANSFDVNGRGLTITAMGSFGATGNNKRIKLFFNPATAVVGSTVGAGGTLLADTGTVTTNGGGWMVSGNVFKYGATGSNTQLATSNGAISGAVHNGVSAPAAATAVESGAILIAVTGNATTAASDILFQWLEVNAMN